MILRNLVLLITVIL